MLPPGTQPGAFSIAVPTGIGSNYLAAYRDKDREWLDGGRNFRLRVSPNPPMKQFWTVTGYDMHTRTLFRNERLKAEVASSTEGLLSTSIATDRSCSTGSMGGDDEQSSPASHRRASS